MYGDLAATKEALWRTLVCNRTRSGDVAPDTYKLILSPRLWLFGLEGGGIRKLFGFNDFYMRNRYLCLFDRTFQDLIHPDRPRFYSRPNVSEPIFTFSGNEQLGFDAVLWAMQLLAWRRLATTDRGYLGLVPASTKGGDYISVMPGCNVPLILRREGECFRVLGECYVHGIMSGEVSKMVNQEEMEMTDITLC